MAVLDLNQVSTNKFINPRRVMGQHVIEAVEFFAVGYVEDLIRGNRHAQENTFGIHVSFVLTLAEAEALTKGKAISWTRCYAPNLKDALNAIRERNDKVLKYLESFAKECGCDFKPYGNGLAIDHYVKHYPQAA